MNKCDISSQELSNALEVTQDKLYEICDIFDSDPSDNWELIEGEHFEWQTCGSRRFSPEGAVEICKYLEENQEATPFLRRFKRWIFRRDKRLKGLMVQKRVQSVSDLEGQLFFANDKAFLGARACREILGLGRRQDILNRTFIEVQRCENTEIEPLQIDVDFFDNSDSKKYLSCSGIASVGKQLGIRLSQKHRREWAQIVAEYAPKALAMIEEHERDKEKRVRSAMDRVRNRAKKRCQLTDRKQNVEKFSLEVHHIFDRQTYPEMADMEDNMIAIAGYLHKDFHKWMGGTHVSCNIDDLDRFVLDFGCSLFPEGKEDQAMKVNMLLSQKRSTLSKIAA